MSSSDSDMMRLANAFPRLECLGGIGCGATNVPTFTNLRSLFTRTPCAVQGCPSLVSLKVRSSAISLSDLAALTLLQQLDISCSKVNALPHDWDPTCWPKTLRRILCCGVSFSQVTQPQEEDTANAGDDSADADTDAGAAPFRIADRFAQLPFPIADRGAADHDVPAYVGTRLGAGNQILAANVQPASLDQVFDLTRLDLVVLHEELEELKPPSPSDQGDERVSFDHKLTRLAEFLDDVDCPVSEDVPLLHQYIRRKNVDMVRWIVEECGANVNQLSGPNMAEPSWKIRFPPPSHTLASGLGSAVGGVCVRPLHVAVMVEDIDVMHFLLARGANIEGLTSDGESPLLLACFAGKVQAAQLLVDEGANLNAIDSSGWPCLGYAIRSDPALVDMLLKAGVDPLVKCGPERIDVVALASRLSKFDLSTRLLAQQRRGTAACDDALAGKDEQAKHEGKGQAREPEPVPPSSSDNDKGKGEAVREHNKGDAVTTVRIMEPDEELLLHIAIDSLPSAQTPNFGDPTDNLVLLRSIMAADAGAVCFVADEDGCTPLILAVKKHSAVSIDLLLSHPRVHEFINHADAMGMTALHHAVDGGSMEEVISLLAAGASPSLVTHTGQSPLLFATLRDRPTRQVETVDALCRLVAEADTSMINVADNSGVTPFLASAWQWRLEFCLWLIEQGADVSAADSAGNNAFHYAMERPTLFNVKECICIADRKATTTAFGRQSTINGQGAVCDMFIALLQHDVPLHAGNMDGNTSFHLLATYNSDAPECVNAHALMFPKISAHMRSCADCQVAINARNRWDRTPLSLAVTGSSADVLQLWLDLPGMQVDGRSRFGLTPLMWILVNEAHNRHAFRLHIKALVNGQYGAAEPRSRVVPFAMRIPQRPHEADVDPSERGPRCYRHCARLDCPGFHADWPQVADKRPSCSNRSSCRTSGHQESHYITHRHTPPEEMVDVTVGYVSLENITYPFWLCPGVEFQVCEPQYRSRSVNSFTGPNRAKRSSLMQALLNAGADVTLTSYMGHTVMWLAALSPSGTYSKPEEDDVWALLFDRCAAEGLVTRAVAFNGETPIHAAVYHCWSCGSTGSRWSSVSNLSAWVEYYARAQDALRRILQAPGADVNLASRNGDTPFKVALGYGLYDVAKLLHEHGATLPVDPFRVLLQPLAFSERSQVPQCSEFLMSLGVSATDVLSTGDTALHCAVRMGQEVIVRLLLTAGAKADAHNAVTGVSVLHEAALAEGSYFCDGFFGLCSLLIHHGASLDSVDASGHRVRDLLPDHVIQELTMNPDSPCDFQRRHEFGTCLPPEVAAKKRDHYRGCFWYSMKEARERQRSDVMSSLCSGEWGSSGFFGNPDSDHRVSNRQAATLPPGMFRHALEAKQFSSRSCSHFGKQVYNEWRGFGRQ